MTGGRYRAVLAANWTFPRDPDGLPVLNGPRNDLAAMRRALTGASCGLFRPQDVTEVAEGQAHEICRAIEDMLATASMQDVVLIYYSGHGYIDDAGTLRLSGRDSALGRMADSVGADEISRMIRRTAAAAVVVLLDCCHAGAFKGGDLTAELAGRGVFVQAASRSRQRTPDALSPDGTSPFTGHLVRGLEGAAAQSGAGGITFVDLYQYVLRAMTEDGPTRPQWRSDGEGNPRLARTPGAPVSAPIEAPQRLTATVFKEHADRVPGLIVEPPVRSRLEKLVRKLSGVDDREETLALVALAGGAAALFTDRALYWLARDSGHVTAVPYPSLRARTFRTVPTDPGHQPTHVDLGDGIAYYAGPGAGALTEMLSDLRETR